MHNLSSPADTDGRKRRAAQTSAALQPLIRLRQIAEELRSAVQQERHEVIMAAAALLGPTVEQCGRMMDDSVIRSLEAEELTVQIRAMLSESELLLMRSMQRMSTEMKRIRIGKQSLALVRGRRLAKTQASRMPPLRLR